MAVKSSNAYTLALQTFISDIKRDEDIRTPFYKEVLSQLLTAPSNRVLREGGGGGGGGPSAEQLALFVRDLDERQKRSSYTRRISDRLTPLLSGLSQYVQAFDVMIQAGPDAASLLYGGARIVLLLAEKFRKCFEDVLSMMERVGHLLQCYHVFARAYEASADMQRLLVETYKNIVSFWQKAAALFSRKAYKTLLTGIVKPLDAEWQRCRQILEADAERVKMLAQATEADIRREKDVQKSTTQESKLRSEIANWIKGGQDDTKLDFRQDIRTHLETRHDDSCEWFFQHPSIEKWLTAKKSTPVWYSAAPGTGKTILSSTLVRKLQDQGHRTVTFFCSFNDLVRKKAINALRSIALQLLSHTESIPERVKQLYEEDLKNLCFKLSDPRIVSEVIETLLKQQSRIHVVIDGLDECVDSDQGPDRAILLHALCHLLHVKTYGIVKFFFASRPDADIRKMMREHSVTEVEASPAGLTRDIRRYVTDRIDHECHTCVEYWTSHAEGNFLWVRHMMDILEGEGTTCDEEIEEELEKFPKGLTGAYMRSLSRLSARPERHQQLARSIFAMLVVAAQPLHLSEFAHALAAVKGASNFSPRSLPKPELIEELCSNLVLFDRTTKGTEDDPLLKLAHKSVQDFFVQDPNALQVPDERLRQYFVSRDDANLELGLSALSYLNYERYHMPQDVSELIVAKEHAFLRHAATFWHKYLSLSSRSTELHDRIVAFLKSQAFWTCIAVQSKIVPYLFATYAKGRSGYLLVATMPETRNRCADDVCYAIPLPDWLDSEEYGSAGARVFEAFHEFVTQWHPVLNSHPEAISQCAMGKEWEAILPGRAGWQDSRVKAYSFQQPNSEVRAIADMQTEGACLKVLAVEMGDSSESYSLTSLMLPIGFGKVASASSDTTTQPVSAALSTNSYLFRGHGTRDHWIVNIRTLAAKHYWRGDDGTHPVHSDTYYPQNIIGTWNFLCTSPNSLEASAALPGAIGIHCARDPLKGRDTFTSFSSEESGYGSMSSSDIDSDVDVDDNSSDGPESVSQYCMVVVQEKRPPTWHFWKSKIDTNAICAFHPSEATAVWSPSPHQLSLLNLDSGKVQTTILPEPVDAQFSSLCALRKELRFSESGDTLYYLLYTASRSGTGYKQIVSLSTFLYSKSDELECVLQRTVAPVSVTYVSIAAPQRPLVLSHWDSDHVYVTLPPLFCNPKVVKMRLPKETPTAQVPGDDIQTLSNPIYFPHSTPCRNPQLKLLPREPDNQTLVLTLDATYDTASDKMTKPPLVMTWDVRSEDWRAWDEGLDGMEKGARDNEETYELLRGSFVDRERRFDVPVRSGLDWRRKAFLSCA